MYNYRIDWIDHVTGSKCCDFLSRESAIWEAKNDILGEIVSITKIIWIGDECEESENLLAEFKAL